MFKTVSYAGVHYLVCMSGEVVLTFVLSLRSLRNGSTLTVGVGQVGTVKRFSAVINIGAART